MNSRLQTILSCMSEEQVYNAIFTDHMTGANNRRALDAVIDKAELIAIIDLDSLKWINDEINHRMGDFYLKNLADRLKLAFGNENVFRLSGDEFVVISENSDLFHELTIVQRHVQFFSFGVGINLIDADAELSIDKLSREHTGKRASRGEQPPWANNLLKTA